MDIPNCITHTKTCAICGNTYPATREYFPWGNKSLRRQCLTCEKERLHRHAVEHKSEKSEYDKKYRAANQEKILADKKRYYLEHKEQIALYHREYARQHREQKRAYCRAYNQANKERIRARQRQYDHEHREERRAQQRAYWASNRDHLLEYHRQYHKEHPEYRKAQKSRRRSLEYAGNGSFSHADVRMLFHSQNGRCWWCGKRIKDKRYHVDHRIPLVRGGTNNPENLCISCPDCNLQKGAKLPQEWNGRLL